MHYIVIRIIFRFYQLFYLYFPDESGKRMFVKMDIEGAEVSVLKGSLDFLKECSNLKIACCTYHREHDAHITEGACTKDSL